MSASEEIRKYMALLENEGSKNNKTLTEDQMLTTPGMSVIVKDDNYTFIKMLMNLYSPEGGPGDPSNQTDNILYFRDAGEKERITKILKTLGADIEENPSTGDEVEYGNLTSPYPGNGRKKK